jgi:hypothetical protein
MGRDGKVVCEGNIFEKRRLMNLIFWRPGVVGTSYVNRALKHQPAATRKPPPFQLPQLLHSIKIHRRLLPLIYTIMSAGRGHQPSSHGKDETDMVPTEEWVARNKHYIGVFGGGGYTTFNPFALADERRSTTKNRSASLTEIQLKNLAMLTFCSVCMCGHVGE